MREVFRQRKDKLQERRSWPLKDTSWELLGPGARGALKQATIVKGLRRDLQFYHQASSFSLGASQSAWLILAYEVACNQAVRASTGVIKY